MRTRLLITIICFLSLSWLMQNAYAGCAQATATSNPSFCGSFKSVAQCQCSARLPSGMCQDVNLIFSRMMSIFGSIQRACEYQHDTSVQNCLDDWQCYRNGGRDSTGALCNATGSSCN